MVTPRFFPDKGGVENHVLKLSRQLAAEGHNVSVLTQTSDHETLTREVHEGISIYRFKHSSIVHRLKLTRLAKWAWLLHNIKMILGYDVVHFHDFTVFWNWYLPFRVLLFWKPVYVTFHGWEGKCPPRRSVIIKRKVVEFLTRGNICIGDYIAKWYGTRPTIVSYGAVEPYQGVPSKADACDLVFIGRLAPDTGALHFIDAVSLLPPERKRSVTIVGDGPLRSQIAQLIKNRDIDCRVLGWQEEPRRYLAPGSIVYVSGFLGILEALSSGCIVVSSFDNPLKEDYLMMMPNAKEMMLIADTPTGLVNEIIWVQENHSQAITRVEKGRSWALQQTWTKLGAQYKELWTKNSKR